MNTNTHFNRSVRREDIRNELVWSLRNKTKSDIVLYVNKLHGRMCYLNKEELSQEMKKWRKLRKENKVEILLFNNKNVFVEKEPYYTLTLQIVGQNEENNVGLDALSMFGFDSYTILVTGYTYLFTRETNRDMVYKYVMGL